MIKGLGTLINILAVLIGGSVGLMVGSRLPKTLSQAVINVLGLSTLVIGMQMAFESKNILIVLAGLVIGTMIGELVDIDGFINRVGRVLERRFSKDKDGKFTRAFVTTSILFCVGPLTILGSIQDGLTGDYTLLATKSLLDGFTSIAFAAAMGIGVLFTTVTILVIQGGLTLFAGILSGVMTEAVIAELTGAGGVMILSIGLGMLKIKKIKTANMLPALVVAPGLVLILRSLGG